MFLALTTPPFVAITPNPTYLSASSNFDPVIDILALPGVAALLIVITVLAPEAKAAPVSFPFTVVGFAPTFETTFNSFTVIFAPLSP